MHSCTMSVSSFCDFTRNPLVTYINISLCVIFNTLQYLIYPQIPLALACEWIARRHGQRVATAWTWVWQDAPWYMASDMIGTNNVVDTPWVLFGDSWRNQELKVCHFVNFKKSGVSLLFTKNNKRINVITLVIIYDQLPIPF